MSKKYNATMFATIADALKKSGERTGGGGGTFVNFMKFPAGHTYTIRLIPNLDNLEDTFFHHYLNQWTSKKDGSFVNALALTTYGERDPITEARWRLYNQWKQAGPAKDEKFDNPIKEKEAWLYNILVVDDPSNPENNGKVKIFNVGPQLKKIIDDAMTGDDADEFGPRIFDLSKDGCDFKIKAEEQGVFTTYKSSRFSTKSKLDLSDEEIDDIYTRVHDLKSVYTVKTADELKNLLTEHFYVDGEEVAAPEKKQLPKTTPSKKPEAKKKEKELEENDDIPTFDSNADEEIDALLSDFDID